MNRQKTVKNDNTLQYKTTELMKFKRLFKLYNMDI